MMETVRILCDIMVGPGEAPGTVDFFVLQSRLEIMIQHNMLSGLIIF